MPINAAAPFISLKKSNFKKTKQVTVLFFSIKNRSFSILIVDFLEENSKLLDSLGGLI
jgi:hypothetical protein